MSVFPLLMLAVIIQAGGPTAQTPAPPATAPAAAQTEQPEPRPKPVPMPPQRAIDEAITRGVDFLLTSVNRDGSWGSPTKTKALNIYAPVPGAHQAFRAAVTSLAVSALIESHDLRPAVAKEIDRGEAWLLANLPKVRRPDITTLYNIWAHAYGIEALARLHDRHAGDAARLKEIDDLIAGQVERLGRYQYLTGGWGYYDFDTHMQHPGGHAPSFTTATVLLALKEAQRVGVAVPKPMVEHALNCVRFQRKPDFTYYYSGEFWIAPMQPINQPGGSLGRSQVCNLALRRWGDKRITDHVIEMCLDRLYAKNMWLDLGRRRPIPHESYFQVAGYFFYYGHYYASQCIDELPEAKRPPLKAQLATVLLKLQDKDGSWWDFPLYNYHQAYGTSFAIMSLARCRPAAVNARERREVPASSGK